MNGTSSTTTLRIPPGPIESDESPVVPGGPRPRPASKTTGVRLDLSEEARRERDADWDEYDRWNAAMSRWIDRNEPGPQPY